MIDFQTILEVLNVLVVPILVYVVRIEKKLAEDETLRKERSDRVKKCCPIETLTCPMKGE